MPTGMNPYTASEILVMIPLNKGLVDIPYTARRLRFQSPPFAFYFPSGRQRNYKTGQKSHVSPISDDTYRRISHRNCVLRVTVRLSFLPSTLSKS